MSRRKAPGEAGDNLAAVTAASEGLGMALLRARETVLVNVRPVLRRHGLKDQQWRILLVLGTDAPLSPTALSLLTSILLPSLLRMLKIMEKAELVRTDKAPTGSRVRISLGRKGAKLLETVRPEVAAAREPLAQYLSLKEVQTLRMILRKIYLKGGEDEA